MEGTSKNVGWMGWDGMGWDRMERHAWHRIGELEKVYNQYGRRFVFMGWLKIITSFFYWLQGFGMGGLQ